MILGNFIKLFVVRDISDDILFQTIYEKFNQIFQQQDELDTHRCSKTFLVQNNL